MLLGHVMVSIIFEEMTQYIYITFADRNLLCVQMRWNLILKNKIFTFVSQFRVWDDCVTMSEVLNLSLIGWLMIYWYLRIYFASLIFRESGLQDIFASG